ncbi:MAG: hypothetical protein ACE1Z4_02685 [Gammaproteobacteria bacterium]
MANNSKESVSSEGMLLGSGSKGKWGTVDVWDVRHPANDAIVRLGLQLVVYRHDTQTRLHLNPQAQQQQQDVINKVLAA